MLIDAVLDIIDQLILEHNLTRIVLKRTSATGKALNYIDNINFLNDLSNYINLSLDDSALKLYISQPEVFAYNVQRLPLGDPHFKQKLTEHLIDLNNKE